MLQWSLLRIAWRQEVKKILWTHSYTMTTSRRSHSASILFPNNQKLSQKKLWKLPQVNSDKIWSMNAKHIRPKHSRRVQQHSQSRREKLKIIRRLRSAAITTSWNLSGQENGKEPIKLKMEFSQVIWRSAPIISKWVICSSILTNNLIAFLAQIWVIVH